MTLYGVDPGPFAQTAWWRRDFAPASIEALMNAMITTIVRCWSIDVYSRSSPICKWVTPSTYW